MVFQLEVL